MMEDYVDTFFELYLAEEESERLERAELTATLLLEILTNYVMPS